MTGRQELLAQIREGLDAGVITKDDVQAFMVDADVAAPKIKSHNKTSAVDVMFYIAGIVLFSAIVSTIAQTWSDGNAFMHIALSAGVGLGLWVFAYILIKSPTQSDVRNGLVNALLLTGSLSVVMGGYIITNELLGGFGEVNFIPAAVMLLLLGAVHLLFDSAIKKDMTLLMGVLLGVAAFPAFLFGILQDSDLSMDVWSVVWIMTAGLLVFATRVVAKLKPDRLNIRHIFDPFAAFIALVAMYASSFGDYGVLWLALLVAAVFGIFYLSIVTQSRQLLGNASFFLVLTVITISFKYFSGYGITTSLILATIGLLGSAAIASMINKKYFT